MANDIKLDKGKMPSQNSLKACDQDIEDIEDIALSSGESRLLREHIVPHPRSTRTQLKGSNNNESPCDENAVGDNEQRDSYVPGTQSIYLKTWGCSHNNSDSEYMAGQLAAYGYQITDDKEKADLWLLNSCTVKNPAEDHFRNFIQDAKAKNKLLVLAGCVPQGQQKSDYMQGLSVVGVQQIDRVVEVVEETLKGNSVRLLGQKKTSGRKSGGASLSLPKIRKNPLIEIIAINTGCLNQCTYCKTKHARGDLGSYPPEEIVERAKQSFSEGVVELWLTSEDLGAYGRDIGVSLPQLLWKLVEVIPEGAMMRLGMTNPPYILEHLEEMAVILSHPRVYSFLHVPVQSASDSVLMEMRREYCVADFKHVVDFLRERVPDVNIATDLICGFPTETDEDFAETLALVSHYKFASLFINQFFPRPGTPAFKMQRIPADEVKKRTKAVSELFQSYHPFTHKLGDLEDVLVTEISHDQQYYVGHNKSYHQVLVPKQENLMGKIVRVKIVETGKHFMKGVVLDAVELPHIPMPLPKGQVSGLTSGVPKVEFQKQSQGFPWFWVGVSLLSISIVVQAYRKFNK
ncbi:threonylcarbamoyladenosine tRNA methylthiotransferase-like isoform X3 [Physella acuta]|uniref:threonylcarbamoyladenosine tRNA methylthiotransferase-like isoform X3 n=1 Tax=Physella acuta TaxID=109671 RepID=UPI0027DB84E5|nr:threonylcarbamoyladenosine tRNA methylthiotransferase-like isoform X3 [Physella acuta]